jgi:hypothetical protein
MINQMGANHPYIRYFKLISEKLNLQINDNVPEIIPNVTPNKISTVDDDTDEED